MELAAQGDENTVAFSLTFNPALLTYQSIALGSGVSAEGQLVLNTNDMGLGRIGVLLGLPSGAAFAAGPQQLVVVTFQIAADLAAATNVPVELGNQPVALEVGSANADALPAQFVGGVVAVVFGYEADVSPRLNGDGRLTGTDWTLVGRFVAGLSTISNASEFARADCAPRSTLGDGRLTATDWTQAGRYVVGLDAPQLAGGPMAPLSGLLSRPAKNGSSGRVLRLAGGVAPTNGPVAVPVELVALGDENTLAFSVVFDPVLFRYGSVAYGTALPPNAQLMLNTNGAGAGRLGVLLGLPSGMQFAAGTQQVLVVSLTLNSPADVAQTSVTFGDDPVIREVCSAAADVLSADYVAAQITFGPIVAPTLGIAWGSDLQPQLLLSGLTGTTCRVEYLGLLGATNWQPLTTVTLVSTNVLVVDPQSATNQTRFYRAVRLP